MILTDYPKEIKAFYMKQNEDGKTVRAMDVLFPHIGEIIGGSEREENYDKLLQRIEELGIPMKDMWWNFAILQNCKSTDNKRDALQKRSVPFHI